MLRSPRNKILKTSRDTTAYKVTDLGKLQANWLVALGQKGRVGARKKEK